MGKNCKPLDNQDIKAEILKNEAGFMGLQFDYAIKNEGMSSSGGLYNKIYISKPIILEYGSIDEPKFDYKCYGDPTTHYHTELPGGNFIGQYKLAFKIENKEIPRTGKYPILLKIYYGKGKVACATFNLVLDRK